MLLLYHQKFPVYALGIVLLFGSILGRAVCGWICPFGFFADILDRFIRIKKLKKKSEAIFKFRYIRYFMVIFILSSFLWIIPYFCIFICQSANIYGLLPYYVTTGLEGFKEALRGNSTAHFFFVFHMASMTILIVFSIIFGGRWFCKYICPLGAVYGLFNLISPINVIHDSSKCVNCGRCKEVCPMDIDLARNSFEDKTGCIKCGRCTKLCKARNFEITIRNKGAEL